MEVDHTSIEIDGTPRVNSARMGDYMGRTVRLVCKVHRVRLFFSSLTATPMETEAECPFLMLCLVSLSLLWVGYSVGIVS